jgi:hypothetical protein
MAEMDVSCRKDSGAESRLEYAQVDGETMNVMWWRR